MNAAYQLHKVDAELERTRDEYRRLKRACECFQDKIARLEMRRTAAADQARAETRERK